jgi:hypothetical protein
MKEVSQEEYLKFKKDVLDGNIVTRTDIPVSALQIDSLKAISFNGVVLLLTPAATNGLLKAMGISNKLVDMLKGAYNDISLVNTILSHVRAAKKSSKYVTLVYNKKTKLITAVYSQNEKVISDSQYFESLEALLDKSEGAFLRNINMDDKGNLHAILSNPNLEFQFGNKKDEVFSAGITFDLHNHLNTSFFTERKVCSNGAVIQDKLCTRSVKYNSDVPDFLQAIISKDYYLDSIHAFKQRINRCYYTIASLNEVLMVEDKLKAILGNYYDILADKTSIERLRNTFGEEYLLAKDQHNYLRTDITLWDLTNEVTAISSRIERTNNLQVSENTNMKLQIIGGDLMFRKPNLASSQIKQIF